MKSLRLLSILLILTTVIVVNCTESNPTSDTDSDDPSINDVPDNFLTPLTCNDFSELSVEVNEINTAGANLSIEMPFSLENASNLNFIFDAKEVPVADHYFVLPESSLRKSIDTTLTDNLICGIEYEVTSRIYLESEGHCTSKATSFVSQGTKEKPSWCVSINNGISGFDYARAVYSEPNLYYLYQNGSFGSFNDNTKTFRRRQKYPMNGTTGTHYTGFSIDNRIFYVYRNIIREYDPTQDSWNYTGNSRTMGDEFAFAEVMNDTAFIFDWSSTSYFLPNFESTVTIAERDRGVIPQFIESFKSENEIFGINANFEILQLDRSTGNWIKKADYPGQKARLISAFHKDNYAYLGFSYNHYNNRIVYTDLWRIDLETFEWIEMESFPFDFKKIQYWETSSKSTDSEFFFYFDGYNNNSYLWSINVDSLKQKNI